MKKLLATALLSAPLLWLGACKDTGDPGSKCAASLGACTSTSSTCQLSLTQCPDQVPRELKCEHAEKAPFKCACLFAGKKTKEIELGKDPSDFDLDEAYKVFKVNCGWDPPKE